MFKKSIILISAIALMFSVSACKEEKIDLTETQKTTSTTQTKQTAPESSAKPTETQTTASTTQARQTAPESSVKPTEIQTTITDSTTEKTTRRETTTVLPTVQENFKTSLDTPDELYLYTDGKKEKISNELISKILPQVNIYLNDTKIGVLKLAVSEDMIEKIKSENKAIELKYDSRQTYVMFRKTGGPDTYKFEKVLIPLDGERKGCVFFCKDDIYQHGPLKPFDSRGCVEEIISILNNG